MHDEILPEAIGLEQFKDKPLTLRLGGKTRVIGHIEAARISRDRTGIFITAAITDEEVAGILGAAQDRNEAVASAIGLSEAEIAEVVGEVKSVTGTVNLKAEAQVL